MSTCTCEGWKPRLRGENKPTRCGECEEIFMAYVYGLWGLEQIIGSCRYCDTPLGEAVPPACERCVNEETRRTSRLKESNPYKKVWNSVEDEESALLDWVKNGTLFVPTMEELARRHMSHSRVLLAKARSFGQSAEGRSAFQEALSHRDKAKELLDEHRKIVLRSR